MDTNIRDDHSLEPLHDARLSQPQLATLDLILQSGKLLFANGQTTEKIVFALKELAAAGGFQATIFVNWGGLTVRLKNGANSYSETIAVEPAGVDMSKVSATMNVIQQVWAGKMLESRSASPESSTLRWLLSASQPDWCWDLL